MKFIRVKCCKDDICPEEGGVGYFCWPGVRLVFTAPPGGAVGWYCRSPVFGNKWNLEALLMKTPLNPRNDGLESDKQVKRIKTALAHRVLWQSRTQTHTHIQPKKKKSLPTMYYIPQTGSSTYSRTFLCRCDINSEECECPGSGFQGSERKMTTITILM